MINIFLTKKKRIEKYLGSVESEKKSAFDFILGDYLSGELLGDLKALGISKPEIFVDWNNHVKCIGVQGWYGKYIVDLAIYPDEFEFAFSLDEPEEFEPIVLESKEKMLAELKEKLKDLPH